MIPSGLAAARIIDLFPVILGGLSVPAPLQVTWGCSKVLGRLYVGCMHRQRRFPRGFVPHPWVSWNQSPWCQGVTLLTLEGGNEAQVSLLRARIPTQWLHPNDLITSEGSISKYPYMPGTKALASEFLGFTHMPSLSREITKCYVSQFASR